MIKFVEESHRYIDGEGKDLISVSEFFKRFQEKLDWTEIARKFAIKQTKAGNPMTTKEVQKKWKDKADKATKVGTLYHSIRESELVNQGEPVFYETDCDMKQCSYVGSDKFSIPINNIQNNTVYPELMIYDVDHMICGQSDKVIIVDNKINIWDYKTDKELSFSAYSSEWVKPRKLLKPLDHLEDCNGNHYAIKMSIYMYMLWKANKGRFKTGEIIIEHIHLKRDEEGIPVLQNGLPVVLKIERIKVPYYKKEVENMFKTIK